MEKAGLPVGLITAMYGLSQQLGAPRTVVGVKIPHPCGDPTLSKEQDQQLRMEIVRTALEAMQTAVKEPVVIRPRVTLVAG